MICPLLSRAVKITEEYEGNACLEEDCAWYLAGKCAIIILAMK